MNELLQKHGCANVFSIPEGLKELMSDISREVLRAQPPKINDFIANYLSVLLITREHGVMAVKILDDLCDCRPSVLEHLHQLGMENEQAQIIADIIKEEIEGTEEEEGKETIKEYLIVKRILAKQSLDEVMTAQVCQIARNAYRDYWYRKKTLEKDLKMKSDVPWEIAAERTLEIYKTTKPSFSELTRATEKIQAAYRGYHVRRNILRHLKPKTKKKRGAKVNLPGPPLDLGGSRDIDLGPMINIKVRTDNVKTMFNEHGTKSLGLAYDPMMTITHVPDDKELMVYTVADRSSYMSERVSVAERKSQNSDRKKSRTTAQEMTYQVQYKTNRVSVANTYHQSRSLSSAAPIRPSVPPSVISSPREHAKMKISFANVPPEVIRPTSAVPSEVDAAEVPEDIVTDDRSEAEGASAPSASVPSSAPSTANTTDVEDCADFNISDGEE